ncbi:hypothetical protein ACLKA6_017169 [Drosophila palustris]
MRKRKRRREEKSPTRRIVGRNIYLVIERRWAINLEALAIGTDSEAEESIKTVLMITESAWNFKSTKFLDWSPEMD